MIGESYTMDLMFQHVQFRRNEKFMKNYIDPGVINKQMMSSNDKLL